MSRPLCRLNYKGERTNIMEHKLSYSHTLTRIFSVRCTCGFHATAGISKAATKKGEAHLAEAKESSK